MTGEFLAQRASNSEIVSIWWRHHVTPEVNIIASMLIENIARLREVPRLSDDDIGVFKHYNDVTWPSWRLQSPVIPLFAQPFGQVYIKERSTKSQIRATGPLWGKSTGDPAVDSSKKGQWRGRLFHVMTSSWTYRFSMCTQQAMTRLIPNECIPMDRSLCLVWDLIPHILSSGSLCLGLNLI